MLRRFQAGVLAWAGCFAVLAGSSPADARGPRHAAMILDANTGAVLHSDAADELRHPASLTKMMTLYLTFETLETSRLSMASKITVSQEAAAAAPSNLELEPGEQISVSDAIRALITKSANDVAVALSEKIGGSQANFVRLMNAKARALGMSKTNFENASGLPNADQVTTARDMITLALHLQDDFPAYYPLFATRAFTYNGSSYRNHNTLMNNLQGIDGIKTGYTRSSGFNLVSSFRRGGKHLVGAVFGGSSAGVRNAEMRMLLSRTLNRASSAKTRKPAPALMAKLKSEPKLAERPAPKPKPSFQIAARPAEKAVAAVRPPDAAAPLEIVAATEIITQPITTAEPASDAPAAAPLEVFKVKRVMVAPRQGPKPLPPNPDETTDMSPDDGPSAALDTDEASAGQIANRLAQASAATASDTKSGEISQQPEPTIESLVAAAADKELGPESIGFEKIGHETVVAKSAEARPDALGSQIAMLGAADTIGPETASIQPPPARPNIVQASLVPPRPKPLLKRDAANAAVQPGLQPGLQRNVQRGLPPSSLQAQASAMALTPQRSAALQPANAASAMAQPLPGRYEIQIGAYGSIDEAQRTLTSVQNRTGKLLAGYASVTHPVQKAGRQVFRARFSGFDAQRAANTCTALRRQAIDCFVMTAE